MVRILYILLLLPSLAVGQGPAVIAHRGGAALAPENTMAAFRKAIELKAEYFELDVMISSDDSLMVIHDNRVNRTTDGTGTVAEMTCRELRELDAGSWFGDAFRGEKVPTLRESLQLAADDPGGIDVVLEIKSPDPEVPGAVVDLVRDLGMQERVIISGFSFDQISRSKSKAPDIPVQLFGSISRNDIDRVASIGGEWVGTGGGLTTDLISYAHKKGIKVNAWTLNGEKELQRAIALGIDALTTDRPGLAMDLREAFDPLTIAACQFPVSGNISANAAWVQKQMKEAADKGADLVHFPECALSGYPGVDLENLEGYAWDSLKQHTLHIMALAAELKLWVLLGSMHPLGDELKPMNTVYVIDDEGRIHDRYDKRFCTLDDLEFFSAGDHFVTFDLKGVQCGVLICFDVRFPELYREYCRLGVDCIFQSFYNARQKPGGIHPKIMPVTVQGHAGINHVYLSITNSSAPNSWPCHIITPDGLIREKLEANQPGILVTRIDLSEKYYDASRVLRDRALKGDLSSEPSPEHPRNRDRQSL